MANVCVGVIEHYHRTNLSCKRVAHPLDCDRCANGGLIIGHGDVGASGFDLGDHPDAVGGITFQTVHGYFDTATPCIGVLHLHYSLDISSSPTFHEGCWSIWAPLEQGCGHSLRGQYWIELPGLVSLVDLGLISFCLKTGKIGEQAWENDRHKCAGAAGPGKLPEKVLHKRGIPLRVLVNARTRIDLTCEDGIVATNPGITLVK